MELLPQLWLPILVSAALAWIASAIMWMVLPHHRKDQIGLPNEQAFVDFVRSQGIPPGNYAFPHFADHKECRSPEAQQKWKEGPAGVLTIMGNFNMGRNLLLTFLVFVVAGVFIAYIGASALPRGASFGKVMQVLGTAGVCTYCFSFIPHMIWFNAYTRAIVACVFDGIVYGLITGAVFAWLWPAAVAA